MSHTVNPLSTVSLSSESGSTKTVKVVVEGATDPGPQPAASGSVSVEFNGHTESVPLNVQFDDGPVGPPAASIDLGDSSQITASVGAASYIGVGRWEIPVTLTVL